MTQNVKLSPLIITPLIFYHLLLLCFKRLKNHEIYQISFKWHRPCDSGGWYTPDLNCKIFPFDVSPLIVYWCELFLRHWKSRSTKIGSGSGVTDLSVERRSDCSLSSVVGGGDVQRHKLTGREWRKTSLWNKETLPKPTSERSGLFCGPDLGPHVDQHGVNMGVRLRKVVDAEYG